MDVLPPNLPDAWKDGHTTAVGVSVALSHKSGKTLPWATVREAIDGAIRARMLEKAEDSGPWPCDLSGAQVAKFKVPSGETPPPTAPPPTPPTPPIRAGVCVAEAELRPNEIQDLADVVGEVVGIAVGHDLKFTLRVELGGDTPPPDDVIEKLNKTLGGISDDLRLR